MLEDSRPLRGKSHEHQEVIPGWFTKRSCNQNVDVHISTNCVVGALASFKTFASLAEME